ncbi:tetratricopeptide repeat protein [Phormidium tenue FACHB-886]|nr:tetratricopeptide repeat protein [Phormidium tenue FACHB-886]
MQTLTEAESMNLQDLQQQANTFFDQGVERFGSGELEAALQHFQSALTLYQQIDDYEGEALTLSNIGGVHQSLERSEDAINAWKQALPLYRQLGNREEEALTLLYIGIAYRRLSNYSEALMAYQQALEIRAGVGDTIGQGEVLIEIADLYLNQAQYLKARETYHSALEIFQNFDRSNYLALVLGGLGIVHNELGEYEQAIDFYQQALKIQVQIEDRAAQAITLNNIGQSYYRLNRYHESLNYYQQALQKSRESGNSVVEGNALNNIGVLYTQQGKYAESIDSLNQALAIYQRIGDRVQEGNTLDSIGTAYKGKGQYTEAFAAYQQALLILKAAGQRGFERAVLSNVGSLLEEEGQPQLAIIFYKKSVEVTEAIRQDLQGLERDQQESYARSVSETYRRLADLLLKQDRVLEAQQVLDLLKVQELDDYLHNVRGNAQTASGIAFFQPEQDILSRYTTLQQTAIELGQELMQLDQKEQQGQLSSTERQRKDELVQLQTELNQKFNEFASSPEVRNLVEQLSFDAREQTLSLGALDRLRDDLGELNAALLYPLVLDDRIELIITTPNSPPLRRTVENVGREEINAAIVALRQALTNPNTDATTPAHKLYSWLIEPIEADLKQANIQTIIYAPDGQLRYIPLAVLYDGDQWLVQRFRVNNITAASLEELTTQPQDMPRILAGAFGDEEIVYPIQVGQEPVDFRGLPFAREEVETLSKALSTTKALVDRAFSLSNVQPLFTQYNILHFATHAAVIPGDASQSFILFGDGKTATLRDIESWTLNTIDLVVLSACETGLGGFNNNGEQILGLGYQFQNRGAHAVIASLWSVNDKSTEILMTAFYIALEQGKSKAEALQQAQTALITNDFSAVGGARGFIAITDRNTNAAVSNSLRHPYYWAPFILIGNGL